MLLFISDSHFGIGSEEAQRVRREKLFACLDHYMPQMQKLFILGDLFDFWFEWRHVILKAHFPILCKLREIRDRGIEIYYLAGNHDFALSRFLQDEIGAWTDLDHFEFESDGKRFYLSHGDGLAPADWGYRILKRVFRNPANQRFYSWLHPDWGHTLAYRSSYASRNHSGRRWDVDGLAYSAAAKELADRGYDFIFFAHTHEPILERAGQGIYVNTGDWLKYCSYAVFDQGIVRLKYWGQPYLERTSLDAR